jgi:general secretion pathway protein F
VPKYQYKSVSSAGQIVEGSMEATSQKVVVESLRDQGQFPLDISEAGGLRALLRRDVIGGSVVKRADLMVATRELSTLMQARMPLDRALRIAVEVAEKPALQSLLSRILERVQGGASLADAVEAEESVFPSYYASMLRAGESGGSLDQVLEQLTIVMERVHALRESLRSALIYPAILLVMAAVTVIVMFTAVLPQFRPLFEDLGDSLPLLTRVFLVIGDAVSAWWWAGALVLAMIVAGFLRALRDPAFRHRWDGVKLTLPVIGALIAKMETARIARVLAMLLKGGQPLLECLAIVHEVAVNQVVRAAIGDVARQLKQGQGLSTPLASTRVFPPMAVHMIRVGEESGHLEHMLEQLADSFDRDVENAAKRLLALLVPVLTVVLGGFIALIIVSVLGALLSVNDLVY